MSTLDSTKTICLLNMHIIVPTEAILSCSRGCQKKQLPRFAASKGMLSLYRMSRADDAAELSTLAHITKLHGQHICSS